MSSHLVVVSGLPRSGTSLMMGALSAGGLSLLTDDQRAADHHNPRGYFEDRRVLELRQRAEWLLGQEGKGVKILSHLLPFIPPTVKAKVIFMRRPLVQILASQDTMLGQQHEPTSPDVAALIERDLATTLTWLGSQDHLQVLEVDYLRILQDPKTEFQRVVDFLDKKLQMAAMVASVHPTLHRHRTRS